MTPLEKPFIDIPDLKNTFLIRVSPDGKYIAALKQRALLVYRLEGDGTMAEIWRHSKVFPESIPLGVTWWRNNLIVSKADSKGINKLKGKDLIVAANRNREGDTFAVDLETLKVKPLLPVGYRFMVANSETGQLFASMRSDEVEKWGVEIYQIAKSAAGIELKPQLSVNNMPYEKFLWGSGGAFYTTESGGQAFYCQIGAGKLQKKKIALGFECSDIKPIGSNAAFFSQNIKGESVRLVYEKAQLSQKDFLVGVGKNWGLIPMGGENLCIQKWPTNQQAGQSKLRFHNTATKRVSKQFSLDGYVVWSHVAPPSKNMLQYGNPENEIRFALLHEPVETALENTEAFKVVTYKSGQIQ